MFKIRGALQTKKRWFELTTSDFAYRVENAGTLIASVKVDDIDDIIDVAHTPRFHVITKCPFGKALAQIYSYYQGRRSIKTC